jgi:hypothetical protein
MFIHSCCCDEPGNPLICDPFEDACGSAVLFSGTGCNANVSNEIVCPRWCSGGTDIGPILIRSSRSVAIEFDPTPLSLVSQGNNRFFTGSGFASVQMSASGRWEREEWEDCVGGNNILRCSPYAHSYTHTVSTEILLSCAEELGSLAQFAALPCTVAPASDDIGYLTLYASSCFKVDNASRFYMEVPTLGPVPSRYICDSIDAYLDAPRTGWLWYAYYKKGDCIVRQPPLIWRPYAGGSANFQPSVSQSSVPCTPIAGTFFDSTQSDFAVRTAGGCDFDWEKNESWSAVYPGSCEPLPTATYGPVANCNAVRSGYCQQTSIQMGTVSIT